jgi:hypothetical protein
MRKLLITTAVMVAIVVAQPAHAGLNFLFSFTNTIGTVPGKVTGEIFGLTNNATSAATDVVITSYPAGLTGVPPLPWDIFGAVGKTVNFNSFTVSSGQITAANFHEIANLGNAEVGLNAVFASTAYNFLFSPGSQTVTNDGGFLGATYTLVAAPEPASIALLLSGLLGIGTACRLRFEGR